MPIVRIFGVTPGGQKGCLHLHRAFPYFYVPYDDDLPRDPGEAGAFLSSLASSLDSALNMAAEARGDPVDNSGTDAEMGGGGGAWGGGGQGGGGGGIFGPGARATGGGGGGGGGGRGGGDGARGNNRKQRRHVHSASLVRGRPFYGFHATDHLFVRISLYDPACVGRASAALLSGRAGQAPDDDSSIHQDNTLSISCLIWGGQIDKS